MALAVSLAGCASAPPPSSPAGVAVREGPAPATERDGPQANPPPGLASKPDAEPRIEPIRTGGPNKPYVALGESYVPITDDRPYVERGLASWYGKKFHGRRTASGEPYDMYAMTAAHPTLPIPSYARVRNPANGNEVIVRINDRGPFHSTRIIDLSYTAALKLGVLRGVAPVEVQRITAEDIRTGAWQRGASSTVVAKREAAPSVPATAARAEAPRAAVANAAPAAPPVNTAKAADPATGATAPDVAASAAAQPLATAEAAALTPLTPPPAAGAADVAAVPPNPSASAQAGAVQASAGQASAGQADAVQASALQAGRGYWVQIGAFRERSGAETFQRRIASEFDWLAPLLAIVDDQALHRLQAGPYPNRADAGSALRRIGEALQLNPVLVERR